MVNIKNQSFLTILLFIIVFALSFKVFPAWITIFRPEWILLGVASMIMIIAHNSKYILKDRVFASLSLFALFLLNKAYFGSFLYPRLSYAIYDILMLFVLAAIPLYMIGQQKQLFLKWVIYGSFLLLIIESISSFFLLQDNPGIIRNMYVMIQESGIEESYRFYGLGLADYGQCHALPVLIPPLFYYFKTNSRVFSRWLSLLLIGVCILLVWLCEATTPLLLAFLMIVLGLLTTTRRDSIVSIILISALFIPFILSNNLQLWALDTLGNWFEDGTSVSTRLLELKASILHGDDTGDLSLRLDNYSFSLDLFLANPVFGTNAEIGRHSAIVDRLATFGLVGFIPLFVFFYLFFKKIYGVIPSDSRLFFIESVMAGVLTLLTKNMWLWTVLFIMCILMPFMFVYKSEKKRS